MITTVLQDQCILTVEETEAHRNWDTCPRSWGAGGSKGGPQISCHSSLWWSLNLCPEHSLEGLMMKLQYLGHLM